MMCGCIWGCTLCTDLLVHLPVLRGEKGPVRHGLDFAQGVEVMGPQKWKRLVDAASRRYKALMTVLRDPAAAKQKAEAAEAARSAYNPHVLCGNACDRRWGSACLASHLIPWPCHPQGICIPTEHSHKILQLPTDFVGSGKALPPAIWTGGQGRQGR